jgi:uncharacterized protein (TIGR00297 family)
MLMRSVIGALLACAIALAGVRSRSLTVSGGISSVVVGTVAVAAGWPWAALLLLYFGTSALISKLGARAKHARTRGVVEKAGARDAAQVAANGAVFTAGLLLSFALGGNGAFLARYAAACALAASAADTWATETGTWIGHRPRSILTLRPMEIGESGGITLPGWLGALAGSAVVAIGAVVLLGGPFRLSYVLVSGMVGTTVDSLLGGLVQERRWCATCTRSTEMHVHDCGTETTHWRGIRRLGNDAVNLLATVSGAAVPLLAALR